MPALRVFASRARAVVYWFQWTSHMRPSPSLWLGWTGKSATGASCGSIPKRAEPMHLVHAPEVAAGLQRIGFEIVSQVIWDKGLFAIGRSWYHWGHEPCWVVRKAASKARFLGERNQSTIWRAPSPKMIMAGSDEPKVDHPTQKPVALYEAPIGNHLRRGESLYDPFLGSGTTLVAAERLGRRCYGMEIDPRYVQVAIERWQTFTGQQAAKLDG